ncbi:MAG: DUF3500 domain-containing protein [Runella sp.]
MKVAIVPFLAVSFVILALSCQKEEAVSPTTGSNTNSGSTTTIDLSSCSSLTGTQKVICLCNAFKSQLSTSQVATIQLSYTKSDAIRWSNFPQALFSLKRVGLNLGAMNETQIAYAKALIKEMAGSSVSLEGFEEIEQILNADNYLKTVNANGGYGQENYYISILGTPSMTGTFAVMFGGHHLAFQNTYSNGQLVGITPSFRGIEPVGTFNFNSVTNQPLEQEKSAFIAILNSLSATELAQAKSTTTISDLVAGPQKDDIPTTYLGVKVGNLTTAQKELVMNAIKTYVQDAAECQSFLDKYQSEINDTYVVYSGNTSLSVRGDYIRIHGPSVWIEWAVQPPVALSQPHIHSVWRDRQKDYGGN